MANVMNAQRAAIVAQTEARVRQEIENDVRAEAENRIRAEMTSNFKEDWVEPYTTNAPNFGTLMEWIDSAVELFKLNNQPRNKYCRFIFNRWFGCTELTSFALRFGRENDIFTDDAWDEFLRQLYNRYYPLGANRYCMQCHCFT